MNNFKILLKKNFLEINKTKKWWIYIGVFVANAILSSLAAKYLLELLSPVFEMIGLVYTPTVADSYAEYAANMFEVGYLLIAIMFASSLVKEKTSSTYYLLKSNGVKDKEIYWAHYVSKLILITVSYIVSAIVFEGLNLLLFKTYSGYRGLISLGFIYLILIFALTVALFISSISSKSSLGCVFAIVSYFVLSFLSIIPHVDVFTPFYSLTLANEVMRETTINYTDCLINAASIVLICAILIFSTIAIFKNKIDNSK